MGGQDCDGSTLPQAPIGSLPIRSDGLPCPSPTDDDRQISSEDRRSVKLRVRPPPAGTHQCHRATSAGSGMMLTVKLTKSSSSDPQDTGLQSVANPPYWASKAAVSLNLTIPRQERCDKAGSVASLVGPMLVPGGSPAGHEAAGGDREATPRGRVWPCAGEWHPAFRHTPAAWPGGGARVRRCWPAPSPRVPRSRAGLVSVGPCVSRGAQTGGVRPLLPPATRRCRGAVPPYAVPRRTRRRGDAVRGAAGPAAWDRRRAGTACACCARYSTSWSPASSSSCSLMML